MSVVRSKAGVPFGVAAAEDNAVFISGYHAEIKYKNVLFYFKAFSHVMGYHDGTQNFTIRKYDMLAFKWRVLSIFSIPGSKVIPKNKRTRLTRVKCPLLY